MNQICNDGTYKDLDNEVDPNSIKDPLERFKYFLPFYRMEISLFTNKLQNVESSHRVLKMDTDFIDIENIKKEFCQETGAWKHQWENLQNVLNSSSVKELVCSYVSSDGSPMEESHHRTHTTKLEFGIMGLLWCTGSQRKKAELFEYLTNPT